MIELSDHIVRLNRREDIQLEVRLHRLRQQQIIIARNYDRDIYWKRLELTRISDTLNEFCAERSQRSRTQTPTSMHLVKLRRNQSAPPSNPTSTDKTNRTQMRPSTTPSGVRYDKRAMSVFKDMTLKSSCPTIGNMLVLLDRTGKSLARAPITRSYTMLD